MKLSTCCFLVIAIFGLGFLTCTGTPPGESELERTAGMPVFIGVSNGHYLSKNRALALALQDAARRVSFFHSVEAVISSSEIYNPQFRISRMNNERKLIYDTEYEKYSRLLEFDPKRDVYEEHSTLFIRAAYTGAIEGAIGHHYRAAPGKPVWIENPPVENDKLFYAVGFAGSRRSYKDTMIASYEDAVYAFVKSGSYKTYASQQVDGNTMLDASFVLVSGVVKGFHVLETWRDPESGSVWTLAAAREVIRKMKE